MTNIKENQKIAPKNNDLYVAYAIIFAIILTPSIKLSNLPSFRIEQLIVVLFTARIIIKFFHKEDINVKKNKFVVMYSVFSIFIVLSIFVGSIKGVNVIINDFFELYKIYMYIGIFLIINLIVNTREDRIRVIKFMMFCIIISILISIQQYFDLFNLNEKYLPLIAPTQYFTLVDGYPNPRVVGMTSNPNVYAVIPGIGAVLSWTLYLNIKNKKNLIFLGVFILGVLMTKSRSGFAFMAIGIASNTFFYFINNVLKFKSRSEIKINLKNMRFIIFVLILIIVATIIIFKYLPKDLTWRLIRGLDLETDSSFQARLLHWEEHINYFKRSPIFGLGPAKSIEYEHYADNEWLLLLRQYGIVGMIYLSLSFVIPFIKRKNKLFKHIYFSVLLASGTYMLVANIYNSFQVMPLVIILAALIPKDPSYGKEDKCEKVFTC